MKKIYASVFALAMTFAANAQNYLGTYSSEVSVDYPLNLMIGDHVNPVVLPDINVNLNASETAGKYKLSINQFTFIGQTLDIVLDDLSASGSEKISFTTNGEFVAGPNANVGGKDVTTVLKINDCTVENNVFKANLIVYIAGTMPFNYNEWLAGLESADEDEAYEAGGIVYVTVDSKDASNFTPEASGIFTPNAETLNIAIAGEDILVNDAEGESFAIYNALGSKIAEGKVFNNQINIANLTSGVYAVVVDNASATFAK